MNLTLPFPFFEKYAIEIKFSSVLQGILLFLLAIVLDGGTLSRLLLLPMIACWYSLLIIMIRRNGRATASDRVVLQYGFVCAALPVGLLIAINEAGF